MNKKLRLFLSLLLVLLLIYAFIVSPYNPLFLLLLAPGLFAIYKVKK
ncbi:hypothetical protein H4K35_15090 [Myroides sp. NP-2]|nr:hypothetical protein [Myroides sp. NP-2]MBB1151410.1 hypothetical protein [Myroides sp. NP-2]